MERAIVMYIALVVALIVHEYMHALVGYLLGDETAKRMGRLTLNPMAHADLMGTVILPIMAIMGNFPVIGWAKPVPFNPYNLRNQKWGPTMVALAGPLSNFAMAVIFAITLKVALAFGLPVLNLLTAFLVYLIIINVVLGIFNFIPVPPLDGSKLIAALLDHPKYRNFLHALETKGPTILLIVILLDVLSPYSILGGIFGRAISFTFAVAGIQEAASVLY